MSFYCFPVSTPAAAFSNDTASQRGFGFEIDLVTEFANTIVDLAGRMKQRSENKSHLPAVQTRRLPGKIAAASNPLTEKSILMVLARDPDALVRAEVIFNTATPVEVLKELATDGDRFVAGQARAMLAA